MSYHQNDIVYSINVQDIQTVATDVLDRKLTQKEIAAVEKSVGDYIDWHEAITNAIQSHVNRRHLPARAS